MALYFLDTSAIVKRYFPEQGHNWITALCNDAQEHDLYISQATLVEGVATICRREREHSITLAERDALIDLFQQDCQNSYNIWPVTTPTYIAAGNLCRSHRLRAYDAVQLACSLAVRDYAVANQAPEPLFVSADLALLTIATKQHLSTENPNDYL